MEDRPTDVWEPAERRPPARRNPHTGGLVWAVILIGAGIILLLNNLGLLGFGVWFDIFRLWPVFLIAGGVAIIFGRRAWVGASLAAVLVAAALIGGVLLYLYSPMASFAGGQAVQTQQIQQPLQGATSARIDINAPVAVLRIGSQSDANTLVTGSVALFQNERLDTSYRVNDGEGVYRLDSRGGVNSISFPFDWFDGRADLEKGWTLNINNNIPLNLSVDTGVGQSTVDVSNLRVTDLDLNTGVGETDVIMPKTGTVQARIQRGVGNVIVRIPVGMAADIQVEGGLGNTDISGEFNRVGENHFQSPDYGTATNRIRINVNGGVGNFEVETFQGR